jgi:hypothetical protein
MLAAVALVAAACTGDDEPAPSGSLPEAKGLLDDAAKAAAEITSTHFVVRTSGNVPGVAFENIDGDLSLQDKRVAAKGTATMTLMGNRVEAKFVLAGGTLYLDPGSGQYQEIPEAQAKLVYDFSAVLDPQRGVAKLIGELADAKTVKQEKVGEVSAYKIDGTATKESIAGLVPQAAADVPVSLWVTAEGHQPVQATATFPGEPAGKLTVTLSKINEPVTVEPPA